MTQEKHYSCTKDASKVAHTIYIILKNIACTVTPNGLCTKANVCYYSPPLKRIMDIVYELEVRSSNVSLNGLWTKLLFLSAESIFIEGSVGMNGHK